MITIVSWIAPFLVLATCAAYVLSVLSVLPGHRAACLRRAIGVRAARAALRVLIAVLSVSAIRAAVVRGRWAWLCRKPPARSEGKLNRADYLTFIGLVETWRQPAAPERSRT